MFSLAVGLWRREFQETFCSVNKVPKAICAGNQNSGFCIQKGNAIKIEWKAENSPDHISVTQLSISPDTLLPVCTNFFFWMAYTFYAALDTILILPQRLLLFYYSCPLYFQCFLLLLKPLESKVKVSPDNVCSSLLSSPWFLFTSLTSDSSLTLACSQFLERRTRSTGVLGPG